MEKLQNSQELILGVFTFFLTTEMETILIRAVFVELAPRSCDFHNMVPVLTMVPELKVIHRQFLSSA